MSQPRQVIPGQTYLITRRCILQLFLLVPSPVLVRIIEYCLAEACVRFGIRLHAYCFLSNHYHLVLTDPLGVLPEFMAHLNRNLAWCVNAYLERKGTVWEPGSYNAVVLADIDTILKKIVYTLANPVAAGLVPSASQSPDQFGTSITVKRPELFFREDGTMPEKVTLTLYRPKEAHFAEIADDTSDDTADESMNDATDKEWKEAVAAKLHETEDDIHSEFEEKGRTFLGVKKVLSTSPHDAPRSRDAEDEEDGIRPRVAGRTASLRRKVLKRLEEFVSAYREALQAFRQGVKDVVFPAGTYKMRVLFNVRCAPVPEFT